MKKKILGLAFIAMSLVSTSALAQTESTATKDNCTQTECLNKGGKAGKGFKKARKGRCAFEGLNLTDAQKAQLKQLGEKREAAAREARKQKQASDSTMRAARRASKKAYLEEVKAIIGPDQYVVFLENFYINGGNQQGKTAMRPGKDGRHGDKGMRFDHRKDGKRGNKNNA